jgi:hypothetical protein
MPAGVSTFTAFGLAVEIGDWHQLTGRTIGAYLALGPSEYVDTTRSTPTPAHLVNEAAAATTVAAAASPCPLDKMIPISTVGPGGGAELTAT